RGQHEFVLITDAPSNPGYRYCLDSCIDTDAGTDTSSDTDANANASFRRSSVLYGKLRGLSWSTCQFSKTRCNCGPDPGRDSRREEHEFLLVADGRTSC